MRTLLLFLAAAAALAGAPLTEGILGEPLAVIEKDPVGGTKTYDRDGDVIRTAWDADMPRAVRLAVLSDAEAAEIWQRAGGELARVKSTRDAKAKVAPLFPYQMRRRNESATVTCLFEVGQDGKVGRIFRVGAGSDSSDLFFKECARALAEWRFPKQAAAGFRAAEFEGRHEKP